MFARSALRALAPKRAFSSAAASREELIKEGAKWYQYSIGKSRID